MGHASVEAVNRAVKSKVEAVKGAEYSVGVTAMSSVKRVAATTVIALKTTTTTSAMLTAWQATKSIPHSKTANETMQVEHSCGLPSAHLALGTLIILSLLG